MLAVKKAADDFNVLPFCFPGGLVDFVDQVVPELQVRGLSGASTRDGAAGPFRAAAGGRA